MIFMPVDLRLLAILVCPESHQALRLGDESLVQQVNEMVKRGTLRDRSGKVLEAELNEILIRQDGRILYPVRGDVPILHPEAGIETSQITHL